MASPVFGHLIITTPILISCNLLRALGTLARHQLDRASVLAETPSSRCARQVASVQAVLCNSRLKLVLTGSVVLIATFCASSQSSRFCAETTSKASRLRAVERRTISSSDLVSTSREKLQGGAGIVFGNLDDLGAVIDSTPGVHRAGFAENIADLLGNCFHARDIFLGRCGEATEEFLNFGLAPFTFSFTEAACVSTSLWHHSRAFILPS
jgi:hypothetical protein